MDETTLRRLLLPPPPGAIGVIGDFCTDVYWDLAPGRAERSIETGLMTTPVDGARYSPGGAGNIVANLRGIGLREIPCFGIVGRDPFGIWLHRELVGGTGYADALIFSGRQDHHTPVYCKPLLDGVEQRRIDLGNTAHPADAEIDDVLASLEALAPALRVLILNEQLVNGLHSPHFRSRFAAFVRRHEGRIRVVFDGRAHLDAYPGVTLKINASAASRLAFGAEDRPPREAGQAIFDRSGEELVVTDGERGCWVFAADGVSHIDAIPAPGPVDTVGAGDSFTAGFAFALANGAPLADVA